MRPALLSLFPADELPPLNPDAERRRNKLGRRVRFRQPKGGQYHPCDTRCTHAKGDECSCACGGANHGIRR